jgi:hypothetical protein
MEPPFAELEGWRKITADVKNILEPSEKSTKICVEINS